MLGQAVAMHHLASPHLTRLLLFRFLLLIASSSSSLNLPRKPSISPQSVTIYMEILRYKYISFILS